MGNSFKSASISNISDVVTEGSEESRSPSKLKFILSIIINLSDWIIIIIWKLGQDGNLPMSPDGEGEDAESPMPHPAPSVVEIMN